MSGCTASEPAGRSDPDAAPGAEAPSDAAAGQALTWTAPRYTLTADEFAIDAGGVLFQASAPQAIEVRGDPGDERYMTVEATWMEHGVEMRLYIYLHNDGIEWWSDEIRTYDGQAEGEWIVYTGDFFRSPMGEAFRGDVDLVSDGSQPIAGTLHLGNLQLWVFQPPSQCGGPGDYVLTKPFPRVDMSVGPAFYRGYVELRDATTCTVIADQTDFAYDWVIDDPGVSTMLIEAGCVNGVLEPCPRAWFEVHPVSAGATVMRVGVTQVSSGTKVASAAIPVIVGP